MYCHCLHHWKKLVSSNWQSIRNFFDNLTLFTSSNFLWYSLQSEVYKRNSFVCTHYNYRWKSLNFLFLKNTEINLLLRLYFSLTFEKLICTEDHIIFIYTVIREFMKIYVSHVKEKKIKNINLHIFYVPLI